MFIALSHINCHFTFVSGALGRRRLAESLLIPIPIGPEPRGQAVLYVVPSLPLLQEARQSVSWALTLKDSCFISRKFIRVASVKEIILNLSVLDYQVLTPPQKSIHDTSFYLHSFWQKLKNLYTILLKN